MAEQENASKVLKTLADSPKSDVIIVSEDSPMIDILRAVIAKAHGKTVEVVDLGRPRKNGAESAQFPKEL